MRGPTRADLARSSGSGAVCALFEFDRTVDLVNIGKAGDINAAPRLQGDVVSTPVNGLFESWQMMEKRR
jgi:hypothetical protein